ncbi:MAG: hypothetical protein LBT11_01560 [Treponema sp.]|jgi:class 3 adenylate cyclase|nr:hypothetical protein [Treponema sp.]
MAIYISWKQAIIRLLLPLAAAAGMILLLMALLAGPRLGFFYDFLSLYRSPPPVSAEILLIDTGTGAEGNLIDPRDAALVISSLMEFDAGALAIEAQILGLSSGKAQSEQELRRLFDGEFTVLAENIRSLFQAIRMGTIRPDQTEDYVRDLVSLADRGKERLLGSVIRQDEAGNVLLDQTAAAWGHVYRSGQGAVYGTAGADPDGVFRRVSPESSRNGRAEQHIVYAMLRDRYGMRGETGPRLMNGMPFLRFDRGDMNILIPLDKNGAVLPETSTPIRDFKRLSLEEILDYGTADEDMYQDMVRAEQRGYFAWMEPEKHPSFLYDHARSLKADLLARPGDRALWIEARKRYFQALGDFFNGPGEANLLAVYESLLGQEGLSPGAAATFAQERNNLVADFSKLRESYRALLAQRDRLQATVEASFCILGPLSPDNPDAPGPASFTAILAALSGKPAGNAANPSAAEASALLANSILTGRAVSPAADSYILLWSLLAALVLVLVTIKRGAGGTIFLGLILLLPAALIFSLSFVFTEYWLDPLIPLGGMMAGTIASAACALIFQSRQAAIFRRIYGAVIAPAYLKQLIHRGRPPRSSGRPELARTAVVVIRQGELLTLESRDAPVESRIAVQNFRREATRHFQKAGAAILGCDGDLLIAAFGSPPERQAMRLMKTETPYEDDAIAQGSHSPAAKAVGCILDLISGNPETASWRFGLDTGDCAFAWSEPGGYTAYGPPIVRARLLSGLCARYKARILVTRAVSEKTDGFICRRLDFLIDQKNGEKEAFYEIIVPEKN